MALPVVADSIEKYLAEISGFPVLNRDQEHTLALRFRKYGDLDAAHALVTSNLKFVVKIALEFRNYGCALKDLVQEGNIGLMTAVKKFDPDKGTRLITYASWWIRSFIQEFILKTRGAVKRGAKALKRKLFYRDPTPLAPGVGAEANGSSHKALEAHTRSVPQNPVDARDLSLNAPIGDNGEDTHLDLMPHPGPDHTELVAEEQHQAIIKKDVQYALATLNERERMVVEQRIMADEPLSLQALGDRFGLTRERVRQIEKETLGKLKKKLPPALLPTYS